MHELPITQSLLEIALRHGKQADAKRITDLHIVMGEQAPKFHAIFLYPRNFAHQPTRMAPSPSDMSKPSHSPISSP